MQFNLIQYNSILGAIGIHLKLLIILACLICIAQVSFQVYILTFSNQGNIVDESKYTF